MSNKEFAMKVFEMVLDYNLASEVDYVEIKQFEHYGKSAIQYSNGIHANSPGRINGFFILDNDLKDIEKSMAIAILEVELSEAKTSLVY